ncbi:hypothetical protein VTK73DRAFT_2304 [Phialemonium thermophilum]|uniref:Uncharacterized protein n=1 Tax=Phialemonium thermophilum TaxID=223376 RepID=A0ABR3VSC5_9PEZI
MAAVPATSSAATSSAAVPPPPQPPPPQTAPTSPRLASPSIIPPRTSSTGQPASTAVQSPPAKSILRSVPEADWFTGAAVGLRGSYPPPNKSSSASDQHPSAGSQHRRRHSSNRKSSGPTVPLPVPPHTASAAAAGRPTSFLTATMAHPTPPPPDPNRFATEDFGETVKRWTLEKEKVVRGPFDYLNGHPGKDFRSQLIHAFDAFLEVPPSSLEIITRVVGMLHTASLLVDDVEDDSELRRGIPVAHRIFGVPQTINSANYVYFCALQEVQRLRNPRAALDVFSEELLNLHRGQGMDLYWRDTLTCPTEDDYLEMVGNKTGGLFRLGVKLMQAESPRGAAVDCVPLVDLVGVLFQIADDYRNLASREYTDNKGLCEDLTEGKFSFPVIHSLRADPANLQLLNVLRQKTHDENVKRYALAYMESTGSFAYTRDVVGVLLERARRMVDELDGGTGRGRAMHKILQKMAV